jgi:hypothetical protein
MHQRWGARAHAALRRGSGGRAQAPGPGIRQGKGGEIAARGCEVSVGGPGGEHSTARGLMNAREDPGVIRRSTRTCPERHVPRQTRSRNHHGVPHGCRAAHRTDQQECHDGSKARGRSDMPGVILSTSMRWG